ncbi:MAG: DUF2393 domain-containing protein [Helicobacteraceae bacterium]|nr:DUF2393 domain-containing protein [Helicobacteraceae bacterium]
MLERLIAAIDKFAQKPEIARLIELSDAYLYSLSFWHLIVFGAIFALTVMCLIAAASLARKRPLISLLMQLLSIFMISVGMIASYFAVNRVTKPISIRDLTINHFYYHDTATVRATIYNNGAESLYECKVRVKGYEPPSSMSDYLMKIYRPLSIGNARLNAPIEPSGAMPFEVDLRGIAYDQNISLSIAVSCR